MEILVGSGLGLGLGLRFRLGLWLRLGLGLRLGSGLEYHSPYPNQWRNEAPGAPATPEGAVIGGRQIVIKMWDNFARLTALLAKVRVWFNNSTIYLDFSAIFSELAPSKILTMGRH